MSVVFLSAVENETPPLLLTALKAGVVAGGSGGLLKGTCGKGGHAEVHRCVRELDGVMRAYVCICRHKPTSVGGRGERDRVRASEQAR